MKPLFSLLIILFTFLAPAHLFGQCTGRYYDKVFPDPNIFVNILGVPIPNFVALPNYSVNYGNAGGTNLAMYIFEPDGDTASKRPLIIFAFGGSFQQGTKASPDLMRLCVEFTSMGYVTASIDYRLLPSGLPVDSANMLKQVVRAVQDAKAAIRFFYKDASTTNTYRIDTNHIFLGGTSAGAFIGVQLGYIRDTVGLPTWMKEIVASQDDLEGNSGNPGYSSNIAGIINLAGAIGDTAWIDPGEPPMVSMHGDDDGTVPYCSEIINTGGNDIIVVDGSATMKQRTSHLGINNPFYTWRGADHVPYVDPTPTSSGPAYMDTTVWFVRDFLFEILTGNKCNQSLRTRGWVPNPCGALLKDTSFTLSTGIALVEQQGDLLVYPNPSFDQIVVDAGRYFNSAVEVEVYDDLGRLVKSEKHLQSKFSLNKGEIGKGIYFVAVYPEKRDGRVARAKVLFQ